MMAIKVKQQLPTKMKVPFFFLCLIILYSTFSNTDTVMASPPKGTIPAYGSSHSTGGVFRGRAVAMPSTLVMLMKSGRRWMFLERV